MEKIITLKKLQKVFNKDASRPEIEAFQLVEIEINFYGTIWKETFVTEIMQDGSQRIINGNGSYPYGTDINKLI